jgi:hypothetical protein
MLDSNLIGHCQVNFQNDSYTPAMEDLNMSLGHTLIAISIVMQNITTMLLFSITTLNLYEAYRYKNETCNKLKNVINEK